MWDLYAPVQITDDEIIYKNKKTLEGRERLVAHILKRLLTRSGSNFFDDGFGTDFYGLYNTTNFAKEEEVKTKIGLVIKRLEKEIKDAQSQQLLSEDLKSSEILVSLSIDNISLDKENGTWNLSISVTTDDGLTTTVI